MSDATRYYLVDVDISEELRQGLGVALNEATWLDMSVDVSGRQVEFVLQILSLPLDESAAARIIHLRVEGVTRLAASLRAGRWDDDNAGVEPLTISELPHAVRRFGDAPIYGWDFINPVEPSWERLADRVSLDARLSDHTASHVIEMFQEGWSDGPLHLDVRVWFAALTVWERDGSELSLDRFISEGVSWWDAMYAGDPRTAGSGIFPAGTAMPKRRKSWRRRRAPKSE